MSLFVMADLHLSLSVNKPMDIFGGWKDYMQKIEENWQKKIKPEDTVVIPGDISWAMGLEQCYKDMEFLNKLNGRKIISKGNHDYWWNTKNKMDNFFKSNGFETLNILHNKDYAYENIGIGGTRGGINDGSAEEDKKVILREAGRLEASISSAEKAGLEPVVFLHYPPVFAASRNEDILDVIHRHNIKWCFYGHLHGKGHLSAINGEREGVNYRLISSDFLQFEPMDITKIVQCDNL